MSDTAEELLRHVVAWPSLRIDRVGCRATLRAGGAASVIGSLDVRTDALVVDVPWNLAGALRAHPRLPPPRHGAVELDLLDDATKRAAIELLRWRTDVERFGWQYRNASP